MDINDKLSEINRDLGEIKQIMHQKYFQQNLTSNWIPIKDVMNWLSYGPTQMSIFLKSENLVVSRIGKRKFVLKESLEKLLEKNKISPSI